MSTTYFDEREFEEMALDTLDLDPLTMGSVTEWCARRCQRLGVPFLRIYEPQWNSKGERIGPRMEISHDAAELVLSVAEAMTRARWEEFERLMQGRQRAR